MHKVFHIYCNSTDLNGCSVDNPCHNFGLVAYFLLLLLLQCRHYLLRRTLTHLEGGRGGEEGEGRGQKRGRGEGEEGKKGREGEGKEEEERNISAG